MKIYVSTSGGSHGKGKERMKFGLLSKLMEELFWVLVISLCKIPIPNYGFDALLCRNWSFSRPDRETLSVTLLLQTFSSNNL